MTSTWWDRRLGASDAPGGERPQNPPLAGRGARPARVAGEPTPPGPIPEAVGRRPAVTVGAPHWGATGAPPGHPT